MTHTNQPTDPQQDLAKVGVPPEAPIDLEAVYRERLAKLVDGATCVVGAAFLDWLDNTHPDVAVHLRTVPNPNRVGLLDAWHASLGSREGINTVFRATEAATDVTKARTYTAAWMLYRMAHRRTTIRTGQDILMRAISERPDHPMRNR